MANIATPRGQQRFQESRSSLGTQASQAPRAPQEETPSEPEAEPSGGGGAERLSTEQEQRNQRKWAGQMRQQQMQEAKRQQKIKEKALKGVAGKEKAKAKTAVKKKLQQRIALFLLMNSYWIMIGLIIITAAIITIAMIAYIVSKWGETALSMFKYLAWIPGVKGFVIGWLTSK